MPITTCLSYISKDLCTIITSRRINFCLVVFIYFRLLKFPQFIDIASFYYCLISFELINSFQCHILTYFCSFIGLVKVEQLYIIKRKNILLVVMNHFCRNVYQRNRIIYIQSNLDIFNWPA